MFSFHSNVLIFAVCVRKFQFCCCSLPGCFHFQQISLRISHFCLSSSIRLASFTTEKKSISIVFADGFRKCKRKISAEFFSKEKSSQCLLLLSFLTTHLEIRIVLAIWIVRLKSSGFYIIIVVIVITLPSLVCSRIKRNFASFRNK